MYVVHLRTCHSVKWLIGGLRRNIGIDGIFWTIESSSPLLHFAPLFPYNVLNAVMKLCLTTSVG